MTQPNPSVMLQTTPTLPHGSAGPAIGEHVTGLTVWLFGLTAMALVFASLMLLGPLATQGALGSPTRLVVAAYAIGMSCIGLFALAYVISLARRLGLLAAPTEAEPLAAETSADGLVVASSVPPRQPLPEVRRLGASHAKLERRPRVSMPDAAPTTRPAGAGPRIRMPSVAPTHGYPSGHAVTQAQATALQLRVAALRTPAAARPHIGRPPMTQRATLAARPPQPRVRTLPPPAIGPRSSVPLVMAGPPLASGHAPRALSL